MKKKSVGVGLEGIIFTSSLLISESYISHIMLLHQFWSFVLTVNHVFGIQCWISGVLFFYCLIVLRRHANSSFWPERRMHLIAHLPASLTPLFALLMDSSVFISTVLSKKKALFLCYKWYSNSLFRLCKTWNPGSFIPFHSSKRTAVNWLKWHKDMI